MKVNKRIILTEAMPITGSDSLVDSNHI